MTRRTVGPKSTEIAALNGRFHDASRTAAKNLPQMRGNAASAIAAPASGRFVRMTDLSCASHQGLLSGTKLTSGFCSEGPLSCAPPTRYR